MWARQRHRCDDSILDTGHDRRLPHAHLAGRRCHNPRMSQAAGPATPADKQTLRRQLRAQRRSRAPGRDRGTDAAAIAAAAIALLDTLPLSPTRTGEHPSSGGQPFVAIYRSLPTVPPTQALAEMLLARGLRVVVPGMLPDKHLDWHELR